MAKKKNDSTVAPEAEVEEVKTEAAEAAEAAENSESEKIQELEKEIAAVREAHIRTLAEYDNYRKRSTREKEALYGDAKATSLAELLPVFDNFERALATTDSDFESFKKGMEMIYGNLQELFRKLGVEPFGEKGEQFDPNIHDGVMHVEDDSVEENVIVDVFSKGYRLGDRILRPAMVKVAN